MPGWLGLPSAALGVPSALGQMQTVADPSFTWGEGGRRMTPEDIALERKLAAQQMQGGADYSPVQSWTQGLARMSQGLIGGMQMADARKDSEANAAQGDKIMQALMTGAGGDDVVARAMMDPSLPDPVRQFAELQYKQTHRPAPQPGEFERALTDSGVAPGTPEWQAAMVKRRDNMLDPLMTIATANGPIVVPRSKALAEGGDPTSATPGGAAPPATLPPDFDAFDKGGPASSKAPATFPR